MQATLQIRRFPTRLVAIALAVTAASAGGGAVGYALRTPTTVAGPTRVVQFSGPSVLGPSDCIRLDNGHKAC